MNNPINYIDLPRRLETVKEHLEKTGYTKMAKDVNDAILCAKDYKEDFYTYFKDYDSSEEIQQAKAEDEGPCPWLDCNRECEECLGCANEDEPLIEISIGTPEHNLHYQGPLRDFKKDTFTSVLAGILKD